MAKQIGKGAGAGGLAEVFLGVERGGRAVLAEELVGSEIGIEVVQSEAAKQGLE